jgi:hypothetical protein
MMTNGHPVTCLFRGISVARYAESLPRQRLRKAKNLRDREETVPEPRYGSVAIATTETFINSKNVSLLMQRILTPVGEHKAQTAEKGCPYE